MKISKQGNLKKLHIFKAPFQRHQCQKQRVAKIRQFYFYIENKSISPTHTQTFKTLEGKKTWKIGFFKKQSDFIHCQRTNQWMRNR